MGSKEGQVEQEVVALEGELPLCIQERCEFYS